MNIVGDCEETDLTRREGRENGLVEKVEQTMEDMKKQGL